MNEDQTKSIEEQVSEFQRDCARIRDEVGKMIVGHIDIIEGVIAAMFAGGNVLLEGVPGVGKTMLVRTLAQTLGLDFSRLQFTPDLMPSDIVGTTVLVQDDSGDKRFRFERGPIFSNIVLADEINRATPKTQSAMLEAMQERSVTVASTTHMLDDPFFVLATQNPLEMEGTYPLPEAQLDRFLFKLHIQFPSIDDLHLIMDRTTARSTPEVSRVIHKERLVEMKRFARDVPVARHIQDYALRILEATHPRSKSVAITEKYVRFGSSPRGAQGTLKAAKVGALMDGRFNVSCEDVRKAIRPALRHRIILNFEGEAEGIKTDAVIDQILAQIPENRASN
jgi:MoxR-like ATPase